MPYPTLIDSERIIATARNILEEQGVESITLRRVAEVLGVKTPSLYRYFANKHAVIRAVNEITLRELFDAMNQADNPQEAPAERLVSIAKAYRRYAHKHPVCYVLAMSSSPEIKPPLEIQTRLVLPLQALVAEITGEANSLSGLRGVYAFVHGWASLEIAQQLRRGGDLDSDFEHSFRAYVRGLASDAA